MIALQDLSKTYGGTTVLHVPQLDIGRGETVGLVGNNGAGKTTMISLILDLIKPSGGQALINGQDVSRSEDWKTITAAFLDESFLISFLTPDEYFEFVGSLYGWPPKKTGEYVLRFAEFFNEEIIGKKKNVDWKPRSSGWDIPAEIGWKN